MNADACGELPEHPEDFGAAVAHVVRSIPPGRVMSYGDVAAALGSRAARQVGNVMAFEGADLPWWRVVRSAGLPPQGHEAAALAEYRSEGTPLRYTGSAWRLDMRRARWSPSTD
ncbi:MGMT family protein [Curtobacterium ammoniigenes]|uniref:MGMT family protein n=1 Tax=Curtobacterium ammoniigenes TaxID=395387 RepID=UPI001FDF853B|nr:MGMT family protein [Curtobacterium ammoniigenes]